MRTGENQGRTPVVAAFLFLVFLGTAVLSSQPLGFRSSTNLPGNADAVWGAWVLNHLCRSFHDPANLLRGNMFHPDPASLLYADPMIGIGLQSIPLCGFDHVALYNATYCLLLAMSALGAWFLALEITGSAWASLVSAAIFSFTSANYDSAARIQIVASQWTPICLLFLIRFCRRGKLRDGLLMGLAFALQSLSSVYFEILLAMLLILTVPWWIGLSGGLAESRKRIAGTMAGIALAAVLILPINLAQRGHLAPILAPRPQAQYLTLDQFTDVLPANFLYGKWLGRTFTAYDALYFPGFIPVALALLFFAMGVRRRDWFRDYVGLKPVLALGLVAFALAFGEVVKTPWMDLPGPVTIFSSWVPGLAQVRVPSRFLMFSRLALAVVAACVVHRVFSGRSRLRTRLAAVVVAAMCVGEHWSTPLDVWAMPEQSEMPAVYDWLEQTKAQRGAIFEFPPALQRLRREEAAWLHTGAFHSLPMVNGYSSFRPAWLEYVMELAIDDPAGRFPSALRTLGVSTIIVHPRPRGIADVDRATETFLDYAARHPDEFELAKSFSDTTRLDGIWSRLGDEKVFRVLPAPVAPLVTLGALLDRRGWTCKSSEPDCERTLDGDPATLLRGRDTQGRGQFLKVVFPRSTNIGAVSIRMGRFSELFPREAVIRLFDGNNWTEVDSELQVDRFVSEMTHRSINPEMVWTFPPRSALGFEIRLRSGGKGFRPLGLPEVDAYAGVPGGG